MMTWLSDGSGNKCSAEHFGSEDAARAAKAIVATGIDSQFRGLFDLARDLRGMSDQIEKAMIGHGFAPHAASLDRFTKRRK